MQNVNDLVEEIKTRMDIVDIISSYIKVDRNGSNYKALCPFHNEKTPSFIINSQKQIYKCFGCGEGGDLINFVMKMENLDFIDAVKVLCDRVGISVDSLNQKDATVYSKTQRLHEINNIAGRYFLSNLLLNKNYAYQYFLKRGLTEKTIKNFGLGYSPNDRSNLTNFLLSRGYKFDELLESGLILLSKNNSYMDRFVNRVMFPIFNIRGKVIGFGGRVLDNSMPKYLNSPETFIFNKRHNLYSLNFARKSLQDDTIIVVEGYMDVISLYQYGFKNVVATLGTALTHEQGVLLKRYAKKVILAYDSDEAGKRATIRAIDILNNLSMQIKVLNLKKYKDPDEYIKNEGFESFKKALDESISHVSFRIEILKKNYNLEKDEEKLNFTKQVSKILKGIKSPIECEFYINNLSKETHISADTIKREIYGNSYKYNSFSKNNNAIFEKIEIKRDGIKEAELQIMNIFINEPKKRDYINLKLDLDDFLLKESKDIINCIIKSNDLDIITIDKLKDINICEDYINELCNINMDFDIDKSLDNIIKTIKKNNLKIKIKELINEQKKLQDLNINDKNINSSEVDKKLLSIGIEIMEKQKMLNDIL